MKFCSIKSKSSILLSDSVYIIASFGIVLYLFFMVIPVGESIHIFNDGMAPKEPLLFSLSVLWGGDAFWLAFYVLPLSPFMIIFLVRGFRKKDKLLEKQSQ